MATRQQTSAIARLARDVSRRRSLDVFVRTLGVSLAMALTGGLVLVLLSRAAVVLVPPESWWWIGVASGLAALAAAVLRAWWSRWSLVRAAGEADRTASTHDVLASALELEERRGREDPEFLRLLTARAELQARTIVASRVVAWRPGSGWMWTGGLAGALALAVWLVPQRVRSEEAATRQRQAEAMRVTEELRALSQAITPATQANQNSTPVEGAVDEGIRAIESELANGTLSPHEARLRAAERSFDRAREIEQSAEEARQSVAEARRALADAARRARVPEGPGRPLIDALRQGNLDAARREIEAWKDETSGRSAEDRETLAGVLNELADQVESGANAGAGERSPAGEGPGPKDPPEGSPASVREQLANALRESAEEVQRPERPDEGASRREGEQAKDSAGPRSPEPQDARPPQSTPDRPPANDRGPQSPGASESRPSVSPPAGAETPRSPSEQNRPGEQTGTPSSPPPAPDGASRPEPQNGKSEPSPARPGERPPEPNPTAPAERQTPPASSTNAQGREGEQRPGGSSATPETQSGRPSDPNASQRSSPGEQSSQPTRESPGEGSSGERSGESGGQGVRRPSEPSPQSRPEGGRSSDAATESGGRQDRATPGPGSSRPSGPVEGPVERGGGADRSATEESGGAAEGGGGDPEGSRRASRGLGEALQRLESQSRDAQSRQETARGLRDQAEQMLSEASPAERARLEEMARRLGSQQAEAPQWRGPTQVMDLRPRESAGGPRPAERTIAQWLSEQSAPPGSGAAPRPLSEPLRRAGESAGRAIEQQSIPPQYSDLVRRVFRRYVEDGAAPASGGGGR